MISCSTEEINPVFPSTHVFLCTTVFSSNIKYPEAMADHCLKSDNFHM